MTRYFQNIQEATARATLYTVSNAKARRVQGVFALFLAVVIGFALSVSRVYAAEEWEAFLAALKAHGYDDVALVYLKQLQANGSVPPEIDGELDYNVGAAAFDAWTKASPVKRPELAKEALNAFKKYLEDPGLHKYHANIGTARLLVDEGDRAYAEAERKGVDEDQKSAKMLEARNAYADAKPYLEAAAEVAKSRAAGKNNVNTGMPGDGSDDRMTIQQAQAAYLDALLRQGTLNAQIARTYDRNSDEFKTGLTNAGKEFEKIADTYGQYPGSFRARLLQAEVLRDLGDVEKAATLVDEIAVLPWEEQYYGLKTRALTLYAEIAEELRDPLIDMNLVNRYYNWKVVAKLSTEYYASAEGLRFQLLAGKALIRLEKVRISDFDTFANAGKKTFVENNDPVYKIMNVSKNRETKSNSIVVFALKTIAELASGKTGTALEAQSLLKDDVFDGMDLSKYSFARKIDDFPSAFDAAVRDGAAFSQARQELSTADPETLLQARAAADSAGEQALNSIRTAIDWGAKAVRPDKKGRLKEEDRIKAQNDIYSLHLKHGVIAFAMKRYHESFVVGEYLTSRQGEFEDAGQGAIVALRSLQALLAEARSANLEEAEIAALQARLDAFSSRVAQLWPENDESGVALEAALIQLDAAVASGNLEAAKALLAQIPENSTRRATAELRMGQALWNEWAARNADFFAALQEGEELDENEIAETKKKQLEILEAARQSLYDGLERILNSSKGASEQDYLAIYSTYLLAQVYDKLGEPAEVEKWLTHPVIGAFTTVNKTLESQGDSNAEETPEFINESFQLAVLALALSVAVADSGKTDEASKSKELDVDKLTTKLEELAAASPESSKRLALVYLRLGKQLEERMIELKDAVDSGDETKKAELDAVVKGFESFLQRAAKSGDGSNYSALRWIADSYLALGRGLSGVSGAPTPESLVYYQQAGRTYQSILKRLETDASFAPTPAVKTAVEIKTSECLRRAGGYRKAFEFLKNTIKANRDNIDVQKEAASIFQDWGREEAKYYLTAIVGAAPDPQGKNYVWGWNGIIRRVAPSIDKGERYKELYYEAYLAKTRCRFLYLRKLKDKTQRDKEAKAAEADIERLFQTRPDLGGQATFNKLDSAYKNFQKTRGVKTPMGLKERFKPTKTKKNAKPANAAK